ncbi:MAG: sulfite exporter TauE/SafE family protein [bacterium]
MKRKEQRQVPKKYLSKGDIMSLFQIGLILAAGIMAGFLNTLGGGGSLITLPVLIFMGLPPAVANGTNRIALVVQNIVGVTNFRSKGFFYPKLSFILGVPAILGSILGARVAVSISGELFEKILAIVMIIVLVLILTRPEKKFIKEIDSENLSTLRLIIAMIAFFGVGLYGGFIQAGVGFIIIVALTLITGMSLVKVNSLKVFIVLIYIISSLIVFLINGKVNFILGFTLAIGNAVGAYLGSNVAVSKGDKWIRVFLVVAILAMSAKLLGFFELIGF